MPNQTNSETVAPALFIEGSSSQIQDIIKHKNHWDAEFQFNGLTVTLDKQKLKKIDDPRCSLKFSLDNIGFSLVKKNFGAVPKDLTFYVKRRKANEVLSPLITNGMKVRIITSDNQEFTLSKSSINLINDNKKLVG